MQRENSENKIKDMMSAAIDNLSSLVDANTIVGKPFTSDDGTVIIPISKVTMGFLTGGGEYGKVKSFAKDLSMPFAGGNGAVISMKPAGFLVDDGSGMKLINVANDVYDRMFDSVEEFLRGLKKEDEE